MTTYSRDTTDVLTREQENEVVERRLSALLVAAGFADDESTEQAIRDVAFAGGWTLR